MSAEKKAAVLAAWLDEDSFFMAPGVQRGVAEWLDDEQHKATVEVIAKFMPPEKGRNSAAGGIAIPAQSSVVPSSVPPPALQQIFSSGTS